jgi:hypothetical protein
MKESVKIVRQCIEKLPSGSIHAHEPKKVLPSKERVYTRMEELIHDFMIVNFGVNPPSGKVYHAIESSKGQLGFHIVSRGEGHPWRMKIRSPSFCNLQALPHLLKGTHDFRHPRGARQHRSRHGRSRQITSEAQPMFTEEELQKVQEIRSHYPTNLGAVMGVLHMMQDKYGMISDEAVSYVAKLIDVPEENVLGVVTFYEMYHQHQDGQIQAAGVYKRVVLLCGSDMVQKT